METVPYSKNIPVTESADVVVCGAGAAGWIAAVSAARRGCSVVLIDRYGFPGGTAAADYVLPISGAYLKQKSVVSDLPMEFFRKLEARGGAIFEMPKGNISFDPELYKVLAEDMLEEAGVKFLSNSYLSDIRAENGRITHVFLQNKNGTEAIAGKVFIDATGDGDVFHLAGAPMQPHNPERQPMSLCFVLAGVDVTSPLMTPYIHHDGMDGRSCCHKEIRAFLLEHSGLESFCGPWFNTTVSGSELAVNITRIDCDATDNRAYAAAERKLRRDMYHLVGLLKNSFREFADCRIVSSGINVGIRETRRILGKYTFTGDDLRNAPALPAPVACCAHPIDIHKSHGPGQTLERLNRYAMIPYDALVTDGIENLIAAGRCISLDPTAAASARVQATCMTEGDAAGAAAAFALQTGFAANTLTSHGFRFADMERLRKEVENG